MAKNNKTIDKIRNDPATIAGQIKKNSQNQSEYKLSSYRFQTIISNSKAIEKISIFLNENKKTTNQTCFVSIPRWQIKNNFK